jgi:Prealbumin-like fold domain
MRRWILATFVMAASWFYAAPASWAARAHVEGVGLCTSSDPPYPFHGSCGTFNGHNTYYGSYGPGFPSPMGWGFCAFEAAHGGWYPAPGYDYYLGSAPDGIDTSDLKAMGWAMSEAQRLGWWVSGNGSTFDADDIAVAGKLLYDNVAWGASLPSPSGQLGKALTALRQLFTTGQSITATPTLNVTLDGGGSTIYTSGTLTVRVAVPGTNAPVAKQSVKVTFTGAIADTSGTAVQWVTTDSSGNATLDFSVPSQLPGSVSVSATMSLAVPGMVFYDPTMFASDAQILASARTPVSANDSLSITALGPPTGTLQILKSVDDAAYYPATGALFQVVDSTNTVVDTLTVDATGYSNKSIDLQFGDYTLRELTPPAHYGVMSDRTVTVVAGVDSVITVGPSDGDVIDRSEVTIQKTDRTTGLALPGATFSLVYDTLNSGVADGETLSCVTDALGQCTFSDLLPGNYFVTETTAPINYLTPTSGSWVAVTPGDTIDLSYANDPVMVTLTARKFNAEHPNQTIPNTIYDLYVYGPATFPLPTTIPLDAPTYPGISFVQRGVTDASGHLTFTVRAGYRWCLHEVWAPKGYIIDPALHCTLTSQLQLRPKMGMAEHASTIRLEIYKFASGFPDRGIPNAYYALFVRGTFPKGFTPAPAPNNLTVPNGMALWAIAKTSSIGQLGFSVPSGYTWCVRELSAPADYRLDPVLHCTSEVLTRSSPTSVSRIAVAELLATTGGTWHLGLLGGLAVLLGLVAWAWSRRLS